MNQLRPFFLILLCGLINACSGNNFDRQSLLNNAADNLIIPAYQDFSQTTSTLHSAVVSFNENPNEETLKSLQLAWEEAIKSWKRAEVYNFGPVEEMILVTSIDRWPTSEAGIETAIKEYDESDDYLVRMGSNRKGLPAIEYLLFHDEPEIVLNEFQDENRKAYLELLSESLVENSELVLDEWESSYRQEFVKATGNRPNSGITLLANEMGYLLEMIRMDKLEVPFGKQTNGVPRLQMLESEYAEISKELITENLRAAQNAFNGSDSTGFDDYLDALNIKDEGEVLLSEAISTEYLHALSIINGMNGSLREAIQNDKESVQQLIDSIQKLYIYTEVDMMSQLSLLDTFSDNDGD
ncbi:imelysin family protein [Gracilimonas sp.]|uniref:imelysin family protein n=1 Tax=Gracilimonas sp. TaxID=1974203 RepID=UPI0032EBEB59